jgi:hypothetical protein
MQGKQHDRAEHDQEQVVLGKPLPGNVDRTAETRRARPKQILRTPGPEREILDHQNDCEGGKQLQQFGGGVDTAQQEHFDQRAEQRYGDGGEHHATPESCGAMAEFLDQAVGQVQAQHEQRAVGEIDDPGDAEDDRQARRHQKERAGAGQAVQELDQDRRSGHRNKFAGTCPASVIRCIEGITAGAALWPRLAAAGCRPRRRSAS